MSRRLIAAVAIVVALVAAGCGDDGSGETAETGETVASTEAPSTTAADAASTSAPPASTTAAPTTVPLELTASDRGVTADSIAVGIMVPDTEQILQFGVDLGWGDVEAHWQVPIDALNEAGGILGRTLVPTFFSYLPVGSDQSDLGCVALTQDSEAFVVFGFIRPIDNALCFTELNDAPLIASGDRLTPDVQARSVQPALIFASSPARADAAMVAALDATGELEGRAIAVHGRDEGRLDDLERELEALGYSAQTRTVLGAPETDSLALDAELDTIVERWRADGVDLVLNVTTSIALAGALERKAFAVDIVTTETDITLDDRDGRGGTPAQFEQIRVLAPVSSSGLIENGHEPSVECRDRWNEARPDETAPLRPEEGEMQNLGLVLVACATVDLFAMLAEAAGADLTHEGLGEAVASIGSFELAGQPSASVSADKWDIPDVDAMTFRTWDADEGRYRETGDPIPVG